MISIRTLSILSALGILIFATEAVHSGPTKMGPPYVAVSFEQLVTHNQQVLSTLAVGAGREDVLERMGRFVTILKDNSVVGNPVAGRKIQMGWDQYELISYVTSLQSLRSPKDSSLMTPVLFKNDRLLAMGEEAIRIFNDHPTAIADSDSGVNLLVPQPWRFTDRSALIWNMDGVASRGQLAVKIPSAIVPKPSSLENFYQSDLKTLESNSNWTKEGMSVSDVPSPLHLPDGIQSKQLIIRSQRSGVDWIEHRTYLSTADNQFMLISCSLPSASDSNDESCVKVTSSISMKSTKKPE